MKTLLDDDFAPITSSIGFLRLGLDDAVAALRDWRRRIEPGEVDTEELKGELPDWLRRLEPLTGAVRPRELLVETSKDWTAYFDCSLQGTDPAGTIGHLAQTVPCQGLVVTTIPHTHNKRESGRMGAVQFQMFGPLLTEVLNYVRVVELAFDGSGWLFHTWGTEQWFEETAAYDARRVRDRFTSEMLERYCNALDLDPFEAGSYGPRAVLVQAEVEVPIGGYVMTLAETQRWLGVRPGRAHEVDG